MEKSLYAQYLMEREGAHIIEKEWGFAVYKLESDHVYLQDIFVLSNLRKDGKGVQLMNEVVVIAKERGLHKMIGSVVPSTSFGDSMLKIMLNLGFKLFSSHQDIVYLVKEI